MFSISVLLIHFNLSFDEVVIFFYEFTWFLVKFILCTLYFCCFFFHMLFWLPFMLISLCKIADCILFSFKNYFRPIREVVWSVQIMPTSGPLWRTAMLYVLLCVLGVLSCFVMSLWYSDGRKSVTSFTSLAKSCHQARTPVMFTNQRPLLTQ